MPFLFNFLYYLFITINNCDNISNGINIIINVAITINGASGIYSLVFFILTNINIIPTIAPIKNDIMEIAIIFVSPKYIPNAPISFTSPSPNASLP